MESPEDGFISNDAITDYQTGGRATMRRRVCRVCGQHHAPHTPHVYDYVEEVDEDVTCHICLQPLVTPMDTPCGHTFCKPCLFCFLKVQQYCPIDRKPLSQHHCTHSSLVLRKILEKLKVKCPNSDHCELSLPRGDLEDHLKYRCPGNWVSCPYSAGGCDFRGPQKTVSGHSTLCTFKDQGVSKNVIVEREVTYIEISRTQTALGIAIVGGADTPLRCVVIQEVFPDGLIAQDDRLQAGDQIIEIDGNDMTNATHHVVCQTLRRTTPVLKLGIYREGVDGEQSQQHPSIKTNYPGPVASPAIKPDFPTSDLRQHEHDVPPTFGQREPEMVYQDSVKNNEETDELIHVTLIRDPNTPLGIKLGGRRSEPGIFIMELMEESIAEQDGRLRAQDRILAINGGDVRHARLDLAFRLIKQSLGHVSLIVSRNTKGEYDHLFRRPHPNLNVAHSRTKSAPDRLLEQRNQSSKEFLPKSSIDVLDSGPIYTDRSVSCESLGGDPLSNSGSVSRYQSNSSIAENKFCHNSGSLGSLSEIPPLDQCNSSLGSINSALDKSSRSLTSPVRAYLIDEAESFTVGMAPVLPPRSRQPLNTTQSFDQSEQTNLENSQEQPIDAENTKPTNVSGLPASGCADVPDGPIPIRAKSRKSRDSSDMTDFFYGVRKSLRIEGSQLHQKTVTISKEACERLGMRIGGGVQSNEGDSPIYIANIHPHGPVGKSKQVKKGDILLSVNGQSLLGLTHTQAVGFLKATAELAGVTLSLLEGPESSTGPANFVPSWLFWQKLPRALQISKSVILHRTAGASLGFSIVGGSDPQRGAEPIHVLFVVSTSPAAVDGKLRCGDRLLAVDGQSLEAVSHATAVSRLKQAGQRVHLEVISWMGTEL